MSTNWLSDGLRTLKDYFGDDDDDESPTPTRAPTIRSTASAMASTTPAKRKAAPVGSNEATLQPQLLFGGQEAETKRRKKSRGDDLAEKGPMVETRKKEVPTTNEHGSL